METELQQHYKLVLYCLEVECTHGLSRWVLPCVLHFSSPLPSPPPHTPTPQIPADYPQLSALHGYRRRTSANQNQLWCGLLRPARLMPATAHRVTRLANNQSRMTNTVAQHQCGRVRPGAERFWQEPSQAQVQRQSVCCDFHSSHKGPGGGRHGKFPKTHIVTKFVTGASTDGSLESRGRRWEKKFLLPAPPPSSQEVTSK